MSLVSWFIPNEREKKIGFSREGTLKATVAEWISAAEAIKWTEVIDAFTDKVRELGRHQQYDDDMIDPYAQFLVQRDQESA